MLPATLFLPALATAQDPLPNIPALMHDVEDHQRAADALRQKYLYDVKTIVDENDAHGHPKKHESNVREIFTVDGVTVDRLLEKDGKPLDDKAKKKEDEHVEKQVREARERRADRESEGKSSDANGREYLSAARILELGTFSNPRRESFNGRSAIVVDYTGDPKAKTHSRFEDAFKILAGTVWIDEETRTLVRAEGRFTDNFHVGGGLVASISKGFHFTALFTRVNGEIWLPQQINAEGSARFLLFFKVEGTLQSQFYNYRKFQSTTRFVPVTPTDDPPAPLTQP